MVILKKVLSLVLVIIMTLAFFSGCSKKVDNPAPTTAGQTSSPAKSDSAAALLPANIKSAGKITIGLDDAYPPMEYRDENNKLVGFDIDFGNAIGEKLGVKIEWVSTAWDGILPSLKANKFDMILSSLSITDERKKEIAFSEPYIKGGPIVITLKGNTSVKSNDDLKGKVVGTQLGSTGDDAASAVNGIKELKKYDKITEALQELSNKRVDAVVADDQVGMYYIGLDSEKYAEAYKMAEEPFGIGFRQSDTALRDAVQKAINDLKTDGTLSKISLKWFKTDYYKN